MGVADNVEGFCILTEINGEAVRLICSFIGPIVGPDSGLGFGKGLRKIQHRLLQFFGDVLNITRSRILSRGNDAIGQ